MQGNAKCVGVYTGDPLTLPLSEVQQLLRSVHGCGCVSSPVFLGLRDLFSQLGAALILTALSQKLRSVEYLRATHIHD